MALNPLVYLVWLGVGTLGTLLFLLVMIMFGKLIKLQMKIWFLAKRGYHLVEHVGNNKVRTYFYLKPDNNKFDFRSGFYLHYPETTTKTSAIIPKTPHKGFSFFKLSEIANEQEGDKLKEQISKLVYDTSAVTLKWGIPIITYVGNNPNPINFQEPEKEYGAQVIRDIYIRLLATQNYDFMRKMITIGIIVMAAVALGLILLYMGYNGANANANLCLHNWNSTANNLIECTRTLAGNTSVVIV
jgi:hypothetical protein